MIGGSSIVFSAVSHVFIGKYGDRKSLVILVNQEFAIADPELQTLSFAGVLGQISFGSRANILEH